MEGFPGHLLYLVALLAVVVFFFTRSRPNLNVSKAVFAIGAWIAVGLAIAVLYLLFQDL